MPWLIILFIISAESWLFLLVNADDLSSFGIKSYQIIRAIHDQTNADTYRRKRFIAEDNSHRVLTLELDHKNITLVLKTTNAFLSLDADIHLGSSTFLPINPSILFEGYVLDRPESSYVSGGFYSNWFDGLIKLANETWHIEPTRKYSTALFDMGPSIIYNALDVDITKSNSKEAFRAKRHVNNESSMSTSFAELDIERESETRTKRQTTTTAGDRERTCCYLYIRVDPTLWDLVYQNEGLNDKESTIHALVTFLYRTVTAANAIYRSVQFQSNNDFLDRFTLRIKRIRILTFDDCERKNLSISETNLCRTYLDSNVLLSWHSAENFAEYCLAYVFSARDFGDGTLGLAWMGSIASNSRGGICEKVVRDIYQEQRILKTLNTGMITVMNHHTRTSALMTELTFVHEIGHSLGAEHDGEKCGGNATDGHYIMYRRATTGLEENNNHFSNCSLQQMGSVMIAVKNQRLGKVNCLTECSHMGYCGNRHVDDDEECDCGFSSECIEKCCYPAGGADPKLACKLKPEARCSPSKGPCCSDQCTFHSSTHTCHKDKTNQDCLENVRCDGTQATCPLYDVQFFKTIDTPCNFNTALCDRGECNKSICTLIGMSECMLTIPNIVEPLRQRGIDREYFCHIGCLDSQNNSCVDTHTLMMPNNYSKTGFGYKYRSGHACAGTTGYCDVFGKCRSVDAEGPLTRLKNMFINDENIHTLTIITREYWWVLILGLLGLIGFLSIFVKICSVHTPSSNPSFKPARSFPFNRKSHNPLRSSIPIEMELESLQQQPSSSDSQNNTARL